MEKIAQGSSATHSDKVSSQYIWHFFPIHAALLLSNNIAKLYYDDNYEYVIRACMAYIVYYIMRMAYTAYCVIGAWNIYYLPCNWV